MTNALAASTVDVAQAEAVAAAPAEEPVDPVQLETSARAHLQATHVRLEALAERASAREQQLADLSERERRATLAALHATEATRVYPGARASAKARLLIAQSQPARSAVQRELDALDGQEQEALQAALVASEKSKRVAEETFKARESLAREALEERAEAEELSALLAPLQDQVVAAHHAVGTKLRDELEAERVQVAARLAAAEAQVAAERAALEALRTTARDRLADHPDVLNAAAGSELVPFPAIPAAQVLAAFVGLLDAVQPLAGKGDLFVKAANASLANVLGFASLQTWKNILDSREGAHHLEQWRAAVAQVIVQTEATARR
jgi:hypothetical protein